ncbi:MAG: sulfatase [Lentisphaerae bacterium]|jgi:arylsulfatase A-like enzyme|nr:sulfatase [Lentisphaerota bacterium]MBT4814714.1 sulfatase [Lentisphaerota bacterium]MBT5611796.1 sulfatase [Lentisphaerota bacterium]MBT7057335.1 sulfatase [Lentisphaerota bacterium]MBT7845842.1 sulfatase [Lentisphaerota bacterium]
MPQRPNILYVMSDDHAANAISCYGSRLSQVLSTPNMDRLGAEGVRLNRYYSTNSICTPARATVMTGQYGHVNGVRTLSDHWDPSCRENLARLLRDAGYTTAMIGKWHLHCYPDGFDFFDILPGQGVYQNPDFLDQSTPREHLEQDNHERLPGNRHEGYVTDIITEKSIGWLRQRDTSKPFFMMCHHKAPHDFWEYAERHEGLFDGVDIPVPDSLFEDKNHRSEGSRAFGSTVSPRNKVRSLYRDFLRPRYVTGPLVGTEEMTFEEKAVAAYQKYLKDYLRTVAGIDDSIGSLLDELEAQGELDNTVVIYTSDQGMFLGEHDYQDKRWSYEESLQAPFLVRYPGEIPTGTVSEQLLSNLDVAPTLLDYAGVTPPESMQGESFRDRLANPAAPGRDAIYFRYWMHLAHRHQNPAHFGIRTERWKLICYYGLPLDASGALAVETPGGWELYDMQNDPFELRNVYEEPSLAETVAGLKGRLHELREQYGDTDARYPALLDKLDEMG